MRARTLKLKRIRPPAAIEGGKIEIEGSGFDPEESTSTVVTFGEMAGRLLLVSTSRLVVELPEGVTSGPVVVSIKNKSSNPVDFEVGKRLLGNVNPVDSPLFDKEGNLYVTFSGKRGEITPVSVYKILPTGEARPWLTNIPNATSLAMDGEGNLYISSRFEGTIYKATPRADVTVFARDLGVPTGLAFGPDSHLYVGDRSGRIWKIDASGEAKLFVEIPESMVAFHLAFDPDGNLLVSSPGFSSYNPLLMIDRFGKVFPIHTGFGRPQGLALDAEGNIYICEAKAGDSEVWKITPDGRVDKLVSGPIMVGVALDGKGNMAITTESAVYKLRIPGPALA